MKLLKLYKMLKVLKAGFYTTVQDKGRVGFASMGVPFSGAMDTYSADLANAILNNNLDDAVIEITFGSCAFEFLEPTVICITGANFSPKIDEKSIQQNIKIKVQQGAILSFGNIQYGIRSYLAVKDGFTTEKILGSRSFYQNITQNFIIKKNDILPYQPFTRPIESSKASIKIDKTLFSSDTIECYKGSEFDLLLQHQQEKLLSQKFSISNDNNRMGYKLNEVLENDFPQILTSAVLPGTVQLTPSGKLIVLMKDCQVTGGYPRVLQLLESSIARLAQKTTNASFQFSLVSI